MENDVALIPFLTGIKALINKGRDQHKEKSLRGENFNVFTLLGVSSSEIRLHSAILGDLLNPKGAHGAGGEFLKAFIINVIPQWKDLLSNKEFDKEINNASVSLEFNIGEKTETTGGRIDILVVVGERAIIIENKIYAGDQDAQLLRYHNYGEKYKEHELLYFTLDGHSPAKYSTRGKLKKDDDFKCISYQEHIYTWISRCVELSHSKPYVRETLNQYLNTIKILTDNRMNNMSEILKTAKESLEEIAAIYEIVPELSNELVREYILAPLETYAQDKYESPILSEDDPYYIRFKKEDEAFEIAVICDVSRNKGWHHLYIAVHTGDIEPGENFHRQKLNSLTEQFTTGRLPYGWEWLETHDWTNPKNFKDIKDGKVSKWIIDKVEAIRHELDANRNNFPMNEPIDSTEAR